MKAVRSATRAACCMLWVTITIVTRCLSSAISSSILSVAIGSSAEQGSSIRITSGLTASERAMHSRCCWPPERPIPGSPRRSETSSHRPAPRSASSTFCVQVLAPPGGQAQAGGDVVEDRHRGEGVGLLEDHPDRAAHRDHVDGRVVHVGALEQHPTLGAGAGDLLVHAVDAADQRRLAAAGGADDGGHLVGAELEVDALQLHRCRRSRRAGPPGCTAGAATWSLCRLGLGRRATLGHDRLAQRRRPARAVGEASARCTSGRPSGSTPARLERWLAGASCQPVASRDQAGDHVQHQDHQHQRERRPPRAFDDRRRRRW